MQRSVSRRTSEAATQSISEIQTTTKAFNDSNSVEIFTKLIKKAQEIAQSAF